MRDNRVLRTELAQYDTSEWDGINRSGITPISDKLLVRTDKASEKVGKQGVIYAPEKLTDSASMASETGIIIAMGDDAFMWNSDRSRPFSGHKPKVGDHIVFERYAGRQQRGFDGETYRLMSDTCVGAVFTGGQDAEG